MDVRPVYVDEMQEPEAKLKPSLNHTYGHPVPQIKHSEFASTGLHLRKTKIVATVGPASENRLKELILAGVNMFRINFSHALHEKTAVIIANIRQTAQELGRHVAILGDLCGPKVRVGLFDNRQGYELKDGETVLLRASDEPGTQGLICTPIRPVVHGLQPGQRLLLDDGNLRLQVIKRNHEDELECKVIVGGFLKEKKGINVPDLELGIAAVTEKDKNDALFILKHRLEYIAVSFVQRKQDVIDLKDFMKANVPHELTLPNADPVDKAWFFPKIIAKIEKPQALTNIESILEETDGIMVARGDLGVECELEEVPSAQKRLIARCKQWGQPVITATQMLESMITNAAPTRAEVSDVANAVYDGTDAVMLSGESASGKYPVEAVSMMARIVVAAERDLTYQNKALELESMSNFKIRAIADAAVMAADRSDAPILVYTESGNMASRLSQRKPKHRIIAVTHEPRVARHLALYWGVFPCCIKRCGTTDELLLEAEKVVAHEKFLEDKQPVVFVSGSHTALSALDCTLRITEFGNVMRTEAARQNWLSALSALKRQQKDNQS